MFDQGAVWADCLRAWLDSAARARAASERLIPVVDVEGSMRPLRAALLDSWGDSCQQALRSPWFASLTSNWMRTSLAWQQHWNESLGQWQHQAQATSRQDIDQLMIALHRMEQRLASAIERIEAHAGHAERQPTPAPAEAA